MGDRLVEPNKVRPELLLRQRNEVIHIAVSPAVLTDVMHQTKSQNMFALLLAHRSGQLLVTRDILIGGGVTAHHLKH